MRKLRVVAAHGPEAARHSAPAEESHGLRVSLRPPSPTLDHRLQ
jgi:hypothetical protein